MAGGITELAKIARRPDNTVSKVVLPNSIYHHPRCQRILRIRNPVRQFRARIRLIQRIFRRIFRQHDAQNSRAHLILRSQIIPVKQNVNLRHLLRVVLHRIDGLQRRRQLVIQILDLLGDLALLRIGRLPHLQLELPQRVVAIGETGLDFYRDNAPRDDQRRVFSEQIDIANELNLPLVIHTRDADEETFPMLEQARVPVVLHCFSSPRLLGPALDRGWYVSFAGNVTYPKATELRTAAASVPADRILAETDSPYLSPQPVRGQPNEPANVVHTARFVAELRSNATNW